MNSKRTVALLLSLVMLVFLFSACSDIPGKTGDTSESLSESEPETTANIYDDKGYLLDDLPDSLDYGQKEFCIFTWSNQTVYEWDADGYTGDVVKDSIYDRILRVEDRLGVRLVIKKQVGEWENRNSFISTVANSVKTGSQAYDLVGQYTPTAAIGAMQELYLALGDVEHLDLTKPWWPGDITESSSINGKLYFATGDITPTLIRSMGTVMANLDLIAAYNIEDVYSLVDRGEWTLDKLMTLAVGVGGSMNGAQKFYGVTITSNVTYDNLFYSGGFRFVDSNPDGTLKLSDGIAGEKMVDWYKKCQRFLCDNPDVALLAINAAFTTGDAIFHFGQMADVQNYLRSLEMNFAILPYPKYDAAQEDYRTISGYWVSMYSIPIDAPDAAMSGAVLECLGSEAYRGLTPAFYRDTFQYRYLNTEVNARMFDLLHDTLVYDTGRTFSDQINIFSAFRSAATPGSEWSSTYAANRTAWSKKIDNIYKTLG